MGVLFSPLRCGKARHVGAVATTLLLLGAGAPAQEAGGTNENTSPRLLREPVAAASVPPPDPGPKPVVLPPAGVLDSVEYILPTGGKGGAR